MWSWGSVFRSLEFQGMCCDCSANRGAFMTDDQLYKQHWNRWASARGSSISGPRSSRLQHLWGGRCLMFLRRVMDHSDEWDLSKLQLWHSKPVVKAKIPSVSVPWGNRERNTLTGSYTDIFLLVKWLWLTANTDHLRWL